MPEPSFRFRVVFGKTGRLKLLSHLEVARACERAVRRADLPFAVTRGYTPRMKVAFGPALPVGAEGVAERETRRDLPPVVGGQAPAREAEGRSDAAASFRLALEREKHHRAMFKEALKSFEQMKATA